MKRARIPACVLVALICSIPIVGSASAEKEEDPNVVFEPELFQTLEYRNIGPFRGGRVTAVAGVPSQRDTFYMGSTGGGVWKTGDGGETWRPVADEFLKSASVGAIAVAPSDPNVVFVGMGSACPRGNISPGDGVYRSLDAGETWQHVGLEETGQIGRIQIHPEDEDLIYVAALGHIFGPNEERGVYRSTDGGENWENVLYVGDRAGAVDLVIDPNNPRNLYAAIWEAERKPWTLVSGGDESGLHRSTDGGTTWERLTEGLPEGPLGKIGVAVSGARPGRVWALVEAEEGGLFRSDDGGKKFRRINDDREFLQRAWYYTHVYADPADADTVYVLNVGFWRSNDGGKTFDMIRVPHGDNHALWINPDRPEVMINGNDGGANVSYNTGRSWSTQTNQPTAEFYRVTTDDRFPYRVYGCQQDNSCISIPSRTGGGSIGRHDWYVIGGGESGHIAVDPRNPDVSYAGSYGGYITRFDRATGQNRNITAWPEVAIGVPARDLRYRFQWNAPIRLSPHDADVLYHAAQYVMRSTDQGQSWEAISPDLTRDDASKQDYAGEPITRDNTGVEVYDTIFAFEDSPHEAGLLWAGTDDGRVHVSRDDGENWSEITPERMPEWGQVNMIELSPHAAGRAFLAVTRYKFDDFRPFIFRTDDFGKNWKLLTDGKNGIPADHFVRVVREDPDREGLLYAGTEFGIYVSFDDGRHWQPLQLKLPVSPITDMVVKNQDLVVATQGRSFWILDDLTPLHQLDREIAGSDYFLFTPRAYTVFSGGGSRGAQGKNPPRGVVIQYVLAEEYEEDDEIVLEILDDTGSVLRSLSNQKDEPRAPNLFARFFPQEDSGRKLTAKQGMNRFVWNLRLRDAGLVDDAVTWGSPAGPRVAPGTYRARLRIGDWSETVEFEVASDPRLEVRREDLTARFELSKKVWESITEAHDAVRRLRDVREQVNDFAGRLDAVGKGEGIETAAKEIAEKLTAIEEKLHQFRAKSSQDVLNLRQGIDGQLMGLLSAVESAQARPTDSTLARYQELRTDLNGYLGELKQVFDTEVAAFNDQVRATGVPAVFPSEGL